MTRRQKLTDWLSRTGMLLEAQVVGSGYSKVLNDMLVAGEVEIVAHPTVRDGKAPAAAIILRKGP